MSADSDLSTAIARDLHRAELVASEVIEQDRAALERLCETLLKHREIDAPMIALTLAPKAPESPPSSGMLDT